MSTAIEFDNVVKVVPPLWDFESEQKFKYRQGASLVTMRQYNSAGSSSSQLTFNNIQLPSPTSIMDPRVFVETQYTFSVTGTITGGAAGYASVDALNTAFQNAVKTGFAVRYMPITQSTSNVTVEIGDGSFNAKPQDYIHALGHFSDCYSLSERELSLSPAFMDRQANYTVVASIDANLGVNGSRSPFQDYGENPYVVPRKAYNGGVSWTFTPFGSQAQNQVSTAVGVLKVIEPLFVSPLTYGDEVRGLTNFTNCNIIISLTSDVARVISQRESALPSNAANVTIPMTASFTVNAGAGAGGPNDSNTRLYATYISAKTAIPEVLHYPHNPITTYKKVGFNVLIPNVQTGPLLTFAATSDSVQLSSVPKRLYVFAEKVNKTTTTPDTFAAISKFQLFVGNGPAMLSQASQKQLYMMSQRNGCQLAWSEWSNSLLSGSILCVDFARDCGLDADWFVGKHGPITAYFNAEFEVSPYLGNVNTQVGYALWAVYVFDGYLTITRGGSVVAYSSVFAATQSENELMDADFMPWVVNPDAMYYGGASMREIGSKIVSVVKGKVIPSARWVASQIMKHPDQAKAIADTVLGIIPYGAELENFVKTVMSFLPAELKERAANALRGSGKMLEQGPAGGTFSGGALAKSGVRKASMMDLCRK